VVRVERLKFGVAVLLLLVAALSVVETGQAFEYVDPTRLYSTTIGDRWVYQAHHSTSQITVFYGEGDHDLLYFEILSTVGDDSLRDWAERSLRLYGEPGGLANFQVKMPLVEVSVGGQKGLSCAYTYKDTRGNTLWEYRIFVLLPGKQGFSMALASDESWVREDPPLLEDILRNWRWYFEEL